MALPEPAIWIDGQPCNSLPLPDRGLDFGDGVFETLLLYRGQPLYPDLHLRRLERGLARLGFPDNTPGAAGDYLSRALADLREQWRWASLRLTVTRGTGPRGYAPPESPAPRVIITASPIAAPADRPAPLSLAVATTRWSIQPRLAGIKHLNRLEQVLAVAEARSAGVDDALMLDGAGNVCSLSAANLFIREGGRLHTPSLKSCGIAGTRRALLLEHWGQAAGLAVVEDDFDLQRLLAADEVFCSNALIGFRPVGNLEGRRWDDYTICRALHRRVLEELPC